MNITFAISLVLPPSMADEALAAAGRTSLPKNRRDFHPCQLQRVLKTHHWISRRVVMTGLHLTRSCLTVCTETSDLWWELLDTPGPLRQKRESQSAMAQDSQINEATTPPAYLVSHLGYFALVTLLSVSCFCFNLEKLSHLFHRAGGGSVSALL